MKLSGACEKTEISLWGQSDLIFENDNENEKFGFSFSEVMWEWESHYHESHVRSLSFYLIFPTL